jgi:hypothetical protein
MRRLLLIMLVAVSLYADIKQEMLKLYQSKEYENACELGFKNYVPYLRDEEFISLYGFACLKIDYVERLSIPINILKLSQESRSNAAYFSIILMQKKLLYHALIDNYDISSLNLPTTDYVLSKVFDLYSKHKKDKQQEFYIFEDEKDNHLKYKLYLSKDGKTDKMEIEEFHDSLSIQKHIYW